MNVCLMVKWMWKLMTGQQGLWADILCNKYLRHKDLLVDSHGLGSQFWNAIQKFKSLLSLGAKHEIRDGSSTRFWEDWWVGSGPLRARFPALFAIVAEPGASVAQSFHDGEWHIPCRGSFSLH